MSNNVYENGHYRVDVVKNPDTEQLTIYPELYMVTNKKTDVIETYETMFPKAISYVMSATELIERVVDKVPQLALAGDESFLIN